MPADPGDLPDLLLREYQGLVAQVRRAWKLDEEAAMDIVHDTIVRVYESIGGYDPEKGEFRGWLWGVLKHAAVRKPQPPLRPEGTQDASPLGDLVGEEVVRFMRASVGTLPESYRRTVEMRYYEGKSLAAIAKELGVPVGTVKARLSRAPEMLKQSMSVQATTARMFLEQMKKKRR
ncbi:MAG: sigma-70 family RNA polymerase sigma factor [Planctomycetes bacterium]|nr:sigma-70 family RNA polymerase sigma factor [Planctomycetota bacterium]